MIQIRRIDHVALRVADLDEAMNRWSIQFGLTEVERVGHHGYLRCGYEPYSLQLVAAGDPGHDHTGWELRRGCSLEQAAGHAASECTYALTMKTVEPTSTRSKSHSASGMRIRMQPWEAEYPIEAASGVPWMPTPEAERPI